MLNLYLNLMVVKINSAKSTGEHNQNNPKSAISRRMGPVRFELTTSR